MNRQQVLDALKKAVLEEESDMAFARKHGFSRSYLSQVLTEKVPPGPVIWKALKLVKKEDEWEYRK